MLAMGYVGMLSRGKGSEEAVGTACGLLWVFCLGSLGCHHHDCVLWEVSPGLVLEESMGSTFGRKMHLQG